MKPFPSATAALEHLIKGRDHTVAFAGKFCLRPIQMAQEFDPGIGPTPQGRGHSLSKGGEVGHPERQRLGGMVR
jgi:hypothetical protein